MAELREGTVFGGDYKIVRPLSAGGMGAVYVVEQISTSKRRALKLMHRELVANAELRARFEQEAKIGARIDSEHVVEVQAAGVDEATEAPYLVMELLDGEDLAAAVARRGALPTTEVAALFEQLGHAIELAHAAGIVHRDLKPENIFLGRARRSGVAFTAKILDFGIAKLIEEGGAHSTNAIGSPMWLAPEQTERAPVTPAADVWALGLIAYFCLVGKSYWRAAWAPSGTVTQLLREILNDPLDSASARAAESKRTLPTGFDAWFSRAVTRDPKDRFPEGGVAVAELVRVLGGSVAHAPAAFAKTEPLPVAAPPPRGPSRRPIVLALVLVPLAVVIAYFAMHSSKPVDTTPPTTGIPNPSSSGWTGSTTPSVALTASMAAAPSASARPSSVASVAVKPPASSSARVVATSGFDAQAASAALATANIDTCGSIVGHGMVNVTFEPDGSVSSVSFDGTNPFVGTKMGQCILDRYAKVHVPPFLGDAVTRHKAFAAHES